MNNTVKRIVEIVFQNVEMTDEVRALQDEVMDNCQERYADLLKRGVSEDDAVAAVVESLRGMEEVLADYPRKAQADGWQPTANEAYQSSTAGISRIQLELTEWDAELLPSKNGRVNVRCEGGNADLIDVRFEGETMRIVEDLSRANQSRQEKVLEEPNSANWHSIGDMLRDVTRFARRATEQAVSGLGIMTGGMVCIEVPESVTEVRHHATSGNLEIEEIQLRRIESSCTSGDLEIKCPGVVEYVQLNTTSGNIEIECPGMMEYVQLNTTSGDIELETNILRGQLNTMSGDVELDGGFSELAVNTVSGDIELNSTSIHMGRAELRTVSGDAKVDAAKCGIDELKINSTSGDLTVRLPDDNGGVHAEIKTVSGDVNNDYEDAGLNAPVQIRAKTVSGDVNIR